MILIFLLLKAEDLISYNFYENKRAWGDNIVYVEDTEGRCKEMCSLDVNCTGLETRPFENRCWLKSGDFLSTMEDYTLNGADASNIYEKVVFQITDAIKTPDIGDFKPPAHPNTRAWGENINYVLGTEDECKALCSVDINCSGVQTSPFEGRCWLKGGEGFKETLEDYAPVGDNVANLYVKVISPPFKPFVPEIMELAMIYDHY